MREESPAGAALSGLYNYILFRWMLPMVPASVMVTGHPRGTNAILQCREFFFFFFYYLVLFIQQDLKAFGMCYLAVHCFIGEVGREHYHPVLQM